MASLTIGTLLGMIVLSAINICHSQKATLLFSSLSLSNLCVIVFALTNEFYVIVALLFIAGIAESVNIVFILSSIQSVVPDDMMGKIMDLLGTLTMALTPIARVTGGILAEFFPIRAIFIVSFVASFLVLINLFFIPSFRKIINFDPETQELKDLMS